MKDLEGERQMIKEVAIKTAQKVVKPKAEEIDVKGEFPWDLVDTFGKQGLLSVLLPEEFGGTNGDLTSFCMVVEEIAKVSGSASLLILAQGIGTLPILIGGGVAQQERYFNLISEENTLAGFAYHEGEIGPDLHSLQTRAERQGKGYVLQGRKPFVTHGTLAGLYSVFAATGAGRGPQSLSAFVVEKGAPGLSFGKPIGLLGMRGSVTADLIFEDCHIPMESRLGEEGEGWKIAQKTFSRSGTASGAQAVGIAQGAIDFAMGYSQERVQFGQPISSFQAVRFMLAEMMTQVEAARSLVYKAVTHVESGLDDAGKLSAMAKSYASDMAMRVTTDAVQILGGYGYMRDYPVERMMRDAKVTQIFGGTNQVQRKVVANHLFRK
jgi:alkylation response protein AidB-like acyl-CoA dehydrogenase